MFRALESTGPELISNEMNARGDTLLGRPRRLQEDRSDDWVIVKLPLIAPVLREDGPRLQDLLTVIDVVVPQILRDVRRDAPGALDAPIRDSRPGERFGVELWHSFDRGLAGLDRRATVVATVA